MVALEKLFNKKYLSSTIILCMDLVMSVLATLMAIILSQALIIPVATSSMTIWWVCGSLIVSWISFMLLRTQRAVIRHSTLRSMARITASVFIKFLLLVLMFVLFVHVEMSARFWLVLILDALITFALLVIVRIAMVVAYSYMRDHYGKTHSYSRVLIYGLSDKSVAVTTRLASSPHYKVAGFLVATNENKNRKYKISDLPVYVFKEKYDIERLKDSFGIGSVLFANEDDARNEQERLIRFCGQCGVKVLIAPSIDEVVDGKVMKQNIREIKIEDLLGRDEIKISIKEIMDNFRGKTVLVTGAAGSIGSELCRQLATFGVNKLVLFDNAETTMHNLRLELEERYPELNFVPVIGDVRQEPRLDYAFRKWRPQIVFHAAAYKHVPLMEENPCESVYVNVVGSSYVADKCIEYDVEKMVMVSTDKAVNPTNIMGCTKRLAEIYVQSLGLAIEQGKHEGRTKFVTTRFGNVLGSNGSVIPRFREQISKGGPLTVTHPEITRFFMTIPEACRLVMEAATMSTGNHIFVFDMGESVKINDLAKRMVTLSGLTLGKDIEIVYTGLRPGEKLYEEVLSDTENTIPTDYNRIRIAMVREYEYDDAKSVVEKLNELSQIVNIPDMVRLMKRTVPEFKSKNSEFEIYDKEIEQEANS